MVRILWTKVRICDVYNGSFLHIKGFQREFGYGDVKARIKIIYIQGCMFINDSNIKGLNLRFLINITDWFRMNFR